MKLLITGTAGFIGFHLAERLAAQGHDVMGIDSINDYYDPRLKYSRLHESGFDRSAVEKGSIIVSTRYPSYRFRKLDLCDRPAIEELFRSEQFETVINLAAQAGVRYSIENPHAYVESNLAGFMNILEGCRQNNVRHLVYASSSSVYGMNRDMPFSLSQNVDHPVSLYAATKKSNELMAHVYSHLYQLPTTGLRFFTVYGPWGRPDMAYFLFARAIVHDEPIKVFNNGELMRDFTYIDDIVDGIERVVENGHVKKQGAEAPYGLYNIGNNRPVKLLDFILAIENALGKKAVKEMLPMQPGDVYATWADIDDLAQDHGYVPGTVIEEGIGKFVDWYRAYYS